MTERPKHIKDKTDEFFLLCENNSDKYPYLIIILMHDFIRNLFPSDPYIELNTGLHRLDAVSQLLDSYIEIIGKWQSLGFYANNYLEMFDQIYENNEDIKVKTGKVYGFLWNQYEGDMVEEAKHIIEERFSKNNISLDLIRGKKVLDSGCGSGRYSCALASLGAKTVIGLDYSDMGIEKANELAKEKNLKNISFIKGSVLDMPFQDEEFDFVFNNGVFHHTDSIEQATKELFRVLKKGGWAWYFIYGDGGLYWYARTKMNEFMKNNIPQSYAMALLSMIGMPGNRFIFCDNWYVPIEKHTSVEQLEKLFIEIGFSHFQRCFHGRQTDFDYLSVKGSEKDRQMWGDGELRYLIEK